MNCGVFETVLQPVTEVAGSSLFHCTHDPPASEAGHAADMTRALWAGTTKGGENESRLRTETGHRTVCSGRAASLGDWAPDMASGLVYC